MNLMDLAPNFQILPQLTVDLFVANCKPGSKALSTHIQSAIRPNALCSRNFGEPYILGRILSVCVAYNL